MDILRVENLSFHHASGAGFKALTIGVREGQILGLAGLNGSGKSTLFNVISGFLCQSEGDVFLEGTCLNGKKAWERASMGLERSWQISGFVPMLTVEEYWRARIGTSVHSLRPHQAGLEGIDLDSRVETLSGGERRALDFSIALSRRARVLLLDEPFSGLDVARVSVFRGLLAATKDRAIVLIDHDRIRLEELSGENILEMGSYD